MYCISSVSSGATAPRVRACATPKRARIRSGSAQQNAKRTLLDLAAIRLGLSKVKHHEAGLILRESLNHLLKDLCILIIGRRIGALLYAPPKHVLPFIRARLFQGKDNVLVGLL